MFISTLAVPTLASHSGRSDDKQGKNDDKHSAVVYNRK